MVPAGTVTVVDSARAAGDEATDGAAGRWARAHTATSSRLQEPIMIARIPEFCSGFIMDTPTGQAYLIT